MKKLQLCLLTMIALFLVGCDCGCIYEYDTTIASNTVHSTSSVYVYADGCSASDGSVDSSGYPTGVCDSSGNYVNRGRWVKVPKASITKDSRVSLGIQGSVFYCSNGYDNQNPSPNFVVYPGRALNSTFVDNSQMVVQAGQMVIVAQVPDNSDSSNIYDGVVIGKPVRIVNMPFGPDLRIPIDVSGVQATCNNLNQFKNSTCRGKDLYGLTIYIKNKELVTLDQTYTATSGNYPYPYIESRTASLFSYISPNDLSAFYSQVQSKHNIALANHGNGNYAFIAPEDGILGFSILNGYGSIYGNGKYTFQVITTPLACYVEQSQASNHPGNRGALEMLVTSTNPNDTDNAIAAFDALNGGNEITTYYQQLNKYIASVANVQITSNAAVLSSLVVSPSLSPVVILQPSYSFSGGNSGDIWLKVRDDYYSDNVGQYYVTANVITKTPGMVSTFLTDLLTPITTTIYGLSKQIYSSFTAVRFLNIVRLCLLIYMMVYGAEFALGLTTISSYDLIIRIFKVAVVIELFNPSSFEFFNKYFFQIFISGSNSLTQFVTGDYTDSKSGIFGFVDDLFNVYFSPGTWIKLAALLPDLVGFLFLLVIVFVIVLYMLVLARAIVAYLLAAVGVALLVSLAPMFLVLILFDFTKKYFDNWIRHLTAYALQPVLMFGALYILTTIFLELWNRLMDFDVCWGQFLKLYMPLSSWTQGYIPNFDLGCIQYFDVKGGIDYINMFGGAFALTIFTFAINNLMSHIPEITDAITGVYTAKTNANKANEAVQKTMDTAGQAASAVAGGAKKMANAASNIMKLGGNKGKGVEMGDAPGGGKPRGKLESLASGAKTLVSKVMSSSGNNSTAAGGSMKDKLRDRLKQGLEMMKKGGNK